VEHLRCKQGVTGSSPVSSTFHPQPHGCGFSRMWASAICWWWPHMSAYRRLCAVIYPTSWSCMWITSII